MRWRRLLTQTSFVRSLPSKTLNLLCVAILHYFVPFLTGLTDNEVQLGDTGTRDCQTRQWQHIVMLRCSIYQRRSTAMKLRPRETAAEEENMNSGRLASMFKIGDLNNGKISASVSGLDRCAGLC